MKTNDRKSVKYFALALAAAMALSLFGCGSSGASGAGETAGTQAGAKAVSAGQAAADDSAVGMSAAAGETSSIAVSDGAEASAQARSGQQEAAPEAAVEDLIQEEPFTREDGGVSINVFAMDTYMTLVAYGKNAEDAVRAAAEEIHVLDSMLSTGKETSEISRMNAAGGGEPSEEVEKLIGESLFLAEKTDGLFNIAIYPVMKIWGFPAKDYRVPAKDEIEKALRLADVSAISLTTREDVKEAQKAAEEAVREADKEAEKAEKEAEKAAADKKDGDKRSEKAAADKKKKAKEKAEEAKKAREAEIPSAPAVKFGIKGMEIDLGGIAKGYTGDLVKEIFSEYKIERGIISLGGNVQAFGSKENGKPWRVAIQNPESSMEYLGILDVADKAVVTSGGYERYFEEKGVRYHHIIDPRTGYPADSGLVSSTIVCDQGILADGLSTSLFIMGKDRAEEFWKNSDIEFDYILEDQEGILYVTEGIADSLATDVRVEVVKR